MTMRILDLYCGVGGATMGYIAAGFEVIGVDIEPQPDFVGAQRNFHQTDAMRVLSMSPEFFAQFDAIHASPPCQASTALTKGTNRGREYPQLIPQTRKALDRIGLPYVIENVQGSGLRRDVTLCGEMFGLDVLRHRYFEVSGFSIAQPVHKAHRGRVAGMRHGEWFAGPYFAVYGNGGGKGSVAQWRQAMGIDWTINRKSIAEAIPPAYTEFIGRQLMAQLTERAA